MMWNRAIHSMAQKLETFLDQLCSSVPCIDMDAVL